MKKKYPLKDISSSLNARFGVAVRDITPPIGINTRNWGASTFDQAIAVHQPLLMHCLSIKSNDNTISVLLTADLGWWKNVNDEQKIRFALLEYFKLKETQLVFTLSHTHAGPSICSTDIERPGGELISTYLDFIQDQAIQCIEEALDNLFVGSMSWNYGLCDLASNRDFLFNDTYLIGYNPLGSPDQTLLVGQICDAEEKLRVVLCNYACHPTTFAHENDLISPDYVGEMRNVVTDTLGVPCIFLQGASGDLAPKKQYSKDPKIVEANGRQLGYAVLGTLAQSSKPNCTWAFDKPLMSGAPLACWTEKKESLNFDLQQYLLEVKVPYKKLPSLSSIYLAYEQCTDSVFKERLWRKYNTRKSIGDKEEAIIPVWLWKWGNTIVVAQANEAYSLFQQKIRKDFPNHCIVFINIANGYLGYLAPQKLYDKDIYAVWQSPYASGSLEILIEKTKAGIQKLIINEA